MNRPSSDLISTVPGILYTSAPATYHLGTPREPIPLRFRLHAHLRGLAAIHEISG